MGLVGFVLLLVGVSIGVGRMRSTQLKRMAYTLQWRYDSRLPAVLTEEAVAQTCFFRQGIHRFSHVLTLRESGTFMRISEDRISSGQPTTYTLVTAELMGGNFTPLILAPRRPQEAPGTNLPAELAEKYTLFAPDYFQLPDAVLGFLRASRPCYVELTPTAFIYHEFDVKPVADIQPLRYRAGQLVQALVAKPQVVVSAAQTQLTAENLETTVLLKLRSASPVYSQAAATPAGKGRWTYGVIFLAFLAGMLFLIHYALMHWVAR